MFCPSGIYNGESCPWFRFITVMLLILKQITKMLMEGGLCSFIPSLSAKLSYAFWINHYAATQANPLHLNVNMITKNKIKSECWGKKTTTTTITKKHKQPRNYTYIIYLRVWLWTYFKYSIYHSHWIFVISFWSSF